MTTYLLGLGTLPLVVLAYVVLIRLSSLFTLLVLQLASLRIRQTDRPQEVQRIADVVWSSRKAFTISAPWTELGLIVIHGQREVAP